MTFTNEQIEEIESLAGLCYPVKKIALNMGIPYKDLLAEYENENSDFYRHYHRGLLMVQAASDMQVVKAAKGGNLTAIQILEKTRTKRHFENMRDQIINGD